MLFKALAIAASQLIQANLGGETVLAGTTRYFAIQSNLEMTNIQARSVTKVREAGDFDLGFLRISTNTLSGSVVYTLQKNGIDQAVTMTVGRGATGDFHDETHSFHVSAGDEVRWKVVSAPGTGFLKQTMAGLRFTPDNKTNTVTFLSTFSPGSLAVSSPGTTLYLAPNGTRVGQATEALAQQRIQEPATWRGLYTVQGTNTRTADTTIGDRKNGADQAAKQGVTITALSSVMEDNVGTVSLAAGDNFNHVLRTSPGGSGTYNLERINSELVSTNNKFFFFTARPGGARFKAIRYIPLAGDLTSSATESEAEFVVKFPFRLQKMIAKVVSNTSTVDGAVLRVRKNGVDELLEVAIDQQTGIFTDNGEFVDLESGDRVCFQFDNPSGNVKIQYIGIVGDETLR
jgi:hypothetical protein